MDAIPLKVTTHSKIFGVYVEQDIQFRKVDQGIEQPDWQIGNKIVAEIKWGK